MSPLYVWYDSCDMRTRTSGLLTEGYATFASEMTTFAAHAPPRRSRRAAPPSSFPHLLLPVLRFLLLRLELRHLLPVHVEERGLLDVHELAHDDHLPEVDVRLAGVRALLDDPVLPAELPLLLVVLHLVQTAADPVRPAVPDGAGRHDLDEREAFLHGRLGDGIPDAPRVQRRPPRDVRGAARGGEPREVERVLEVPVRRRCRLRLCGRRRTHLPARHPVVEVVDANHMDVHVPPRGVDEVVPADREQVPVPAEHGHVQVRVRKLQPRREGDRASVRRMVRVDPQEAGRAPRAADARHDRPLVPRDARLLHPLEERVERDPEAAAGTPDVGEQVRPQEFVPRVDLPQLLRDRRHAATSRIPFRVRCGWGIAPGVYCTNFVVARPATARSTSCTIWPKFTSGTRNAFAWAASSWIRQDGKGHTVRSRRRPALTPSARASSTA